MTVSAQRAPKNSGTEIRNSNSSRPFRIGPRPALVTEAGLEDRDLVGTAEHEHLVTKENFFLRAGIKDPRAEATDARHLQAINAAERDFRERLAVKSTISR